MSQPDHIPLDKLIEADPDLAEFSDLISNLRAAEPVEPEAPSPALWAGIAAAANADPTAAPRSDAAVVDLAEARRRRTDLGRKGSIFLAAAAAILLVAVPLGLALRNSGDGVELAAADLGVLSTAAAEPGNAVLLERDGDNLWLEVSADAETEGTDFLELWLLRVDEGEEIQEIVSLGRYEGSERYDVPDDLDLGATWLVDISVEADDGDDSHGGNSALRGALS